MGKLGTQALGTSRRGVACMCDDCRDMCALVLPQAVFQQWCHISESSLPETNN